MNYQEQAKEKFDKWNKGHKVFFHDQDCNWRNSQAPIDVCPCQCYRKQIFIAGYVAAKESK